MHSGSVEHPAIEEENLTRLAINLSVEFTAQRDERVERRRERLCPTGLEEGEDQTCGGELGDMRQMNLEDVRGGA